MNRYSDFRTLWKGLSTEYPRLEAFDFPPKTSVFSRRSLFFRARRVEETRQRKFTAILQMLVSCVDVGGFHTVRDTLFVNIKCLWADCSMHMDVKKGLARAKLICYRVVVTCLFSRGYT